MNRLLTLQLIILAVDGQNEVIRILHIWKQYLMSNKGVIPLRYLRAAEPPNTAKSHWLTRTDGKLSPEERYRLARAHVFV